MGVTVLLPDALVVYAGGRREIAVPAAGSVGEALEHVVQRHPSIRPQLFDERGALRAWVNTFVNQDDTRGLGGVTAAVSDGDTITIVPSIAGGSTEAGPKADDATGGQNVPVVEPGNVALDPDELRRYSRHLILPQVGLDGQRRLKAAKVLCIGAGGLGSPVALYLAAAGVGTLGIVDFDLVDETNLQRQILHGTSDVGRPKIDSARDRLADVNPHVDVVPHPAALDRDNALDILEPYDLVIDGTDNFPTRYLVNDACVLLGKPNVYGSILRFDGQLSVFWAERGPCYRCLFREPPPPGLVPSCAESGVLGVLPGIVGSLQALEAIKLITGRGDSMIGRLLLIDALAMRFRELKVRKDPACPMCGENPSITGLIDYDEFCGVPRADSAASGSVPSIGAARLRERLAAGERLRLIDVREPYEWQIANLGGFGAALLPLGDLAERIGELDRSEEIVLYCRSGQRSAQATRQLLDAGFEKVLNLDGGLLAWSDEVDPSMPRY